MYLFCSNQRIQKWHTAALSSRGPSLPASLASSHSEDHKDRICLWLRSTPTFFGYMLTRVLDALLSCSLPLTPKPWPTLLSRAYANSVSLGTGRWKRMTHADLSGPFRCIWMIPLFLRLLHVSLSLRWIRFDYLLGLISQWFSAFLSSEAEACN